MNANGRRLRENEAEQHPSNEIKEERTVHVEKWIEPNDHARIDNCVKTNDNNEEGKNENRHDELCDDDSDDEEEEVYRCDARNNND